MNKDELDKMLEFANSFNETKDSAKQFSLNKGNMTWEDKNHISNLDIDEDVIYFLDKISDAMNQFFVSKNGKRYWFHEIKFRYSCFTGYQAYIKNTDKQKMSGW